MMANDSLPHIKWSITSQSILLKKYKELGMSTPSIVRITESPSNSHLPTKLVQEDLLLHSIVPHRKVICQCVDFVSKDGQLCFSSQRFSIPLGYSGWFEILTEDGKTVSPSKTIEHIAERAPDKFLVRSKTKAYPSGNTGEPDYDRTKVVEKGEVMSVIGRVSITHGWRKQKKHILHCLDSNGVDIYFDFKTTGQFSPMAGPTNISGVHSIEGLIGQFRLPLTVRIVSGQIPRVASDNERPGVFRLIETQKDNTALFLPVRSHQKLIPVSIRTNLQLIQASNMTEISKHQYYKLLLVLCDTKVEKYFRTMQVLVSAKQQPKTYSACTLPVRRKTGGVTTHPDGSKTLDTEEDVLFAEVDDLYAYVRRGGAPPKPRPRSWATNTADASRVHMEAEGKSNSQPLLAMNGKPRGLLATLTAGKFPAKSTTLVRQHKLSCSTAPPDHGTSGSMAKENELPVAGNRTDLIKSYIDKHLSVESLQTEVDPYVDEGHYKASTENLNFSKKYRYRSMDELRPVRPKTFLSPFDFTQKVVSSSPTIDEKLMSPMSHQHITSSIFNRLSSPTSPTRVLTFLENNTKFQRTVQAT